MEASLGDPRVLLVDGNEADRAEVGAALRAAGIRVVGAVADGAAAVEVLAGEAPNIAIVDVGLAGCATVVAELKERAGDGLRVIALAAPEAPDRAAELVESGARAYVLKHKRAEVIDSVRAVAAGSGLVASEVSGSVLDEVQRLQVEGVPARESLQQLGALRELSITDWLTGLKNQRYLIDRLRGEVDRALRHGRPVALLVLALDRPDLITVRRGRDGVDKALLLLAQVMTGLLRNEDVVCRTSDTEFGMLLPESDAEGAWFVAQRIREAAANLMDIADLSLSIGIASIPEHADGVDTILQAAEKAVYVAQGEGENVTRISGDVSTAADRPTDGRSGRLRTVDTMVRLLALRDPALEERSRRIADMAVAIGTRFRLTTPQLEHLRVAALVYDIGKVGVPDVILHKPGPLDEDEWRAVRDHRANGVDLVASVVPTEAADAMRSASEHVDGSGHPIGLRGEQIPLLSRILAVTDAYTAMTEARPFRPTLEPADALGELRGNAGTQFDPLVVDALMEIVNGDDATVLEFRRLD